MQTHFSLAQLADPDIQTADGILRACVHCGFCTATCPTYRLLGDENDSPRGRIMLAKAVMEADSGTAPKAAITHFDRCLTCQSCMTTCPSGVDYATLVGLARDKAEEARPASDRWFRKLVSDVLTRPALFRLAVMAGKAARPFRRAVPTKLQPFFDALPKRTNTQTASAQITSPKGRVALLTGCVQSVIADNINQASIRVLQRAGYEVFMPKDVICCGALPHHLGQHDRATALAARTVEAWSDLDDLDAVIVNTSGCGPTIKDYPHLLRHAPDLQTKARAIADKAQDVSSFLSGLDIEAGQFPEDLHVAYHPACSLQHGLKQKGKAEALLKAAGAQVSLPKDSHLCCGSAGTYSLLQPELARQLKDEKLTHLSVGQPDVIASGNVGCLTHLGSGSSIPTVHSIELIDWAQGGPRPF